MESPQLDKFPYTKVADWLREGEMIPFLGAGASRVGIVGESGPPDGKGTGARAARSNAGFPGMLAPT